MASTLISLAIFMLLIFLCVKGIMWGATFMVLLEGALSCLVVALIQLFALPADRQIVGPNVPYLPICVSAVVCLSTVLSLFVAQKNENTACGHHNKTGIAVLGVGIFLWFTGIVFFCIFIFGGLQGGPNPTAAVVTFSLSTLAGSISLCLAAKYESVRFPNMYRWLAFWAAVFMLTVILAFSLIFMYAVPAVPPVSHPFWASITTLNYVPVALLFIGLNKNYVKKKPARDRINRTADAAEFTFE